MLYLFTSIHFSIDLRLCHSLVRYILRHLFLAFITWQESLLSLSKMPVIPSSLIIVFQVFPFIFQRRHIRDSFKMPVKV
jgi:hypothetical protein